MSPREFNRTLLSLAYGKRKQTKGLYNSIIYIMNAGRFLDGMRQRIKQQAEEMTHTAAKNKEMPDGVIEWQPLPAVKYEAGRVGKPTCNQPDKTRKGDHIQKRFDSEDDKPSHDYIEQDRQGLVLMYAEDLEEDTKDCAPPYYAEYGPAQGAIEIDQGKGCISSRDKQIYRGVIKHPEYPLCLW